MSKGTYQRENLFDVAIVQQTITGTNLAGVVASADDLYLIEQLRSGNEAAFEALIDRYATAMLRLAMVYVRAWAVAEEVVQETWLAVLEGLGRFEGRSSLKTWMFRILTNCAKTRAQREGRSIPFSSLEDMTPITLNMRSTLIASCQWITSGQVIGYHSPPIGRKCRRIACFHGKRVRVLIERSRPYRPISVRSSPCATSKDGRQRKPVPSSAFPRSISGCSSTVHGRRCAGYLRNTSRKSSK